MFDRHGGIPDRLTPDQLAASLARATRAAPRGDLWVFAYGSLLWNPVIHFAERRVARLHGFHRRFCLWSNIGRGTRDHPGLMLGLEPGGSCVGAALRVPRASAQDELALLWRREMIAGSYAPRWLALQIDGVGRRSGLVFVMDRGHGRYAGKLTEARVAKAVGSACGPLGTCREYFEHTRTSLAELGVVDGMLERLRRRIG
jgi:cation transport protein ChaC